MNAIFSKIDSKKYDEKHCFLCGKKDKDITQEHVIPQWIQKRFDLYNQKIYLLNGTPIDYRYLTVPCCKKCNNIHLSNLENSYIKKSFDKGFQEFKKIDKEKLYYWLSKIYYGLLYRELSLLADRSRPELGNIVTPELFKSFKLQELFMRGVLGEHKFLNGIPSSLLIFETQIPKNAQEQWDFSDTPAGVISLRMADIGIVGTLFDGGANDYLSEQLEDFRKVRLHPIQFRELSAMVTYKATLFNRTPKYVNITNKDVVETIRIPLMGLSNKPMWDEWNQSDYAKCLSAFTGIPVKILNPFPDKIRSSIKKDDGSPNFIDVNEDIKIL